MGWKLPSLLVVSLLIFGLIYAERVGEKTPGGNDTSSGIESVVIVLDRAAYRVGDNLTLIIINSGNETIIVGSFYRLYRFESGKWREIPTGFSFTGIGYQIEPGKNWNQTLPLMVERNGKLESLSPGRYRIEKTTMIDSGPDWSGSGEIILSAEFEVVG